MTDNLLTTEECCALYEQLTGRRIKPKTWSGYVSRTPAWPQPVQRGRWDRAEVEEFIRQRPRTSTGEDRPFRLHRRPDTVTRIDELQADTGATITTLFNAGIKLLHDVWQIQRSGGVVTGVLPGPDGTVERRDIGLPAGVQIRRDRQSADRPSS